ncbi:helix-turn-helix transcriptional regulator [Marinomonas rhodophyticola]|uniref:HTH domain-containing protein n=1 Tax=Marinomonas rhodophyticola TaxID=2992803 RepID=A0ABT3KC97_9GAMM|nr:HTH domain-containing protein [Marinomonas sp. KJ51-3]MCW4628166.1 HTH domain-containing protein [Marinomonas sp. KJ51-3]
MTRANTTQRMDRLEQAHRAVKSHAALTTKMVAAELNISERTLFRDIAILRERGLPIEADKGRGGGIRLHHQWGVGRVSLGNHEIIDLLISLAMAESMGSTLFVDNIKSLRHKLMASPFGTTKTTNTPATPAYSCGRTSFSRCHGFL